MSEVKRQASLDSDLHELRAAERRMQRDLASARRKESAIVLRLALKERENSEMREQIQELRQQLRPARTQTTTLMLDPAVNAEMTRLREEVKQAQRKEKVAQDALEASEFQSGSIAGKKLMQKCKDLQVRLQQPHARRASRLAPRRVLRALDRACVAFVWCANRRRTINSARTSRRGACRS